MNTPVRRLAVFVGLLFLALLVNANVVQVVEAGSLRDNPHNSRVLVSEYQRQRGPIVAGGKPVARSVHTPKDNLAYLRTYPGGPEYAPVTGFYSLVYGSSGIEKAENGLLAGSSEGLFLKRFTDLLAGRKPRGGSVVLTIDPAAQDAAWNGLNGRDGAVVALNPRTGAILALASSPSYDPSVLTTHDPNQIQQAYARLKSAPGDPLLDRALNQRYPPGSTFKVITTVAALETGNYTPQSVLPAPPRYKLPLTNVFLQNFQGETCGSGGQITLQDALRISCNTAYAILGHQLGADALRSAAESFGFDDGGLRVPMPVAKSQFPASPDQPQTALSAIGQFDVAVTPLQMAMVAAGIANGGTVMRPYLVAQTKAADLSTLSTAHPEVYRHAVSGAIARTLTQMMELVVQSGTGTAAQIPGVRVAGKTGTAQHGTNAPEDAWFICFAPADNPQVAVAVVLPNAGKTGGEVAAPVARAVMQAVLGR